MLEPQRVWLWALLVCTSLFGTACQRSSRADQPNVERVQFGIFFGGQVQQRQEIPFELDPSRQAMGFVLEFEAPLEQALELRWELSKPGKPPRRAAARAPADLLSAPDRRLTELHRRVLAEGDQRFVQSLGFAPGDTPGLWNLRITLPDRVVLDRPFTVYDPTARERARRRAHPDDGGLF